MSVSFIRGRDSTESRASDVAKSVRLRTQKKLKRVRPTGDGWSEGIEMIERKALRRHPEPLGRDRPSGSIGFRRGKDEPTKRAAGC